MAKRKLNIDEFPGVVQAYGDSVRAPGAVEWQFGLQPDHHGHMKRIGGALNIASSNDYYQAVISMGQLEFQDEDFLLVHHMSTRELIEVDDIAPHVDAPDGIEEYGT